MERHSAKETKPGRHRALASFVFVVAAFVASAASQTPAVSEIQVQKCWEHRLEGSADRRLAADAATIFIVRGDSIVQAFSSGNGSLLWSSDIGGNVDSNLAAAEGSLFLVRRPLNAAENSRSSLISLSAATGVTKWASDLPDAASDVTLAATGGVVLAVSEAGAIVSADARNGRVIWSKRSLLDIGGAPFLAGSSLYFAAEGKNIGQMSLDGVLSTAVSSAPFSLTALARSDDASIVAGDERGQVTMFSGPAGKVIWKFTTGAAISSILLKGPTVIAASNDNFIYALAMSGGGRIWKRRVSARVQGMRLLGDDVLMVETMGERDVQLLDFHTGKTVGKIGFAEDESPVAALTLSDSLITVMTNDALYLYGTAGCTGK